MEYKRRIKTMKERAERIRLPWRDLIKAAGVHRSTLHRWLTDQTSPRLRDLAAALDAMEGELARRETEMRDYLDGRAA